LFDFFQKHKRFSQVFLGLIALTFATWGIESYTSMRGGRDRVATVNGSDISQREFAEQLRQRQERLRQMLGNALDPAVLESPELRSELLESLISQRLVATEAAREHLYLSREAVIDAIVQAPDFQEDGKFSPARYQAYLASRNTTDERNVADLQQQLPLGRLVGSIADTAIAPRSLGQRLAAIETERREVSEARIPVQQFLAQARVDEAEAKAYYDANAADYRLPERVRAEYLVLSAEALAKQETVDPGELKTQWQAAYGEKLRAKDEARKKAQEVLAAARKNPAGFAELAKRESQDSGSAASGGDLGFAPRGSLVKPVEDALFQLKEGAISDLVESEFGFHILRVTGIRGSGAAQERRASHILIAAPTDAKPFEEMRGAMEAELKRSRAAKRFAEAAENFNNIVYEQPESLKPAAERFKLQIQTTGWIGKSASQELGALDNPKLLAALFSPDSLKTRRNTDAIEVAPSTMVAARVIEHEPPKQRDFAEVRKEITELLRQRKASELAYKDGAAKLERLKKGEDAGVAWGPARSVSRREAQGLPADVLRRVVRADVSKLPAYIGVPIPDAGYLLLRISKVVEGEAKELDPQGAARIAGMVGEAQYEAYVAALRSRADIEVRPLSQEPK
jgi:peptidyl-prolyl cis-trans isomerase D